MKESTVVTRKDLIEICNKFLNDKIEKFDIENFASNVIFNENIDFEDDTVEDVIYDWDNETISFEINQKNVRLWKEKLLSNKDELLTHNSWNFHINFQKEICEKYQSEWKPINKKSLIGISENKNLEPINGLRHLTEKGEVQWFIWFGEWSDDSDIFKPMCAKHLLDFNPKIVDYLGLEPGFRFLIDRNGYEDVWFDEKLLTLN